MERPMIIAANMMDVDGSELYLEDFKNKNAENKKEEDFYGNAVLKKTFGVEEEMLTPPPGQDELEPGEDEEEPQE